jgi:hypothetical protein
LHCDERDELNKNRQASVKNMQHADSGIESLKLGKLQHRNPGHGRLRQYGTEHIGMGMHYQDAISGLHDNHLVADMRKLSDMASDQLPAGESIQPGQTMQSA